MSSRSARVIAVTSGKGGVGKTNVSVNLAVALQRLERETMLVDCDMGLANANILLGVDGRWTISDLLGRHCELEDIVLRGPGGVRLVPGHSGTGIGSRLGQHDRSLLAHAFQPFADALDHVIVDTGSGIGSDTLDLVASSDLVLLVLSPEPTAFMDAYATVKALSVVHGCEEVAVVTNAVEGDRAGIKLFDTFAGVIGRFLDVRLSHLGSVPADPLMREAVLRKRALVDVFPSAPAARAFARLADAIAARDLPPMLAGARFFGLEAAHGAC